MTLRLQNYGIGKLGLNLLLSYLSNRKQRPNVNSSYTDWYDIISSVPQASILGPLLFNLFINDLFLFLEETNICNFADDNKIYRCDSVLEIILEDLQHDMKILLNWFKINLMKPNPEAVVQRCSVKKVFLEISQNSRENTCARVSFLLKLLACNFIKKETLAKVFSCEFYEIFKSSFFYRTPLVTAFANSKKLQFMILGKGGRLSVTLNISKIKIRESQKVMLSGLTIDHCLTFKNHIDILYCNASYKLHALRRIRIYLTPDKAKFLYNAFINSQFSYASIIWMFCRKTYYLKLRKSNILP